MLEKEKMPWLEQGNFAPNLQKRWGSTVSIIEESYFYLQGAHQLNSLNPVRNGELLKDEKKK